MLTDSLPELTALPDGTSQREDRAVLVQALMRLSYGQRAAVVLRYWLDMSEAETAAVLGCSVGNVNSQTARGLAKLRTSAALVEGGLL
jgi:RNA polymerase sigma factor (sigma-70 family)